MYSILVFSTYHFFLSCLFSTRTFFLQLARTAFSLSGHGALFGVFKGCSVFSSTDLPGYNKGEYANALYISSPVWVK